MTALDVIATIEALPGRGDVVADLLAGALDTVRAEQGCLRYDLFRVRRHADTLMMVERWASKDDLRAHGASEHFTELAARMGPELASPPDVRVLDPVA
ncbi:antibiotic biosynthesis monooxygenase [Aeromicrobium sp. A1-2]|uniref:putative quinol monooxygenase n=1 Tax=Aeromicrobium sp. A1-2 TaxID=2107713 RepID=UPI000E53BA42|nr:putative quinol monooxygenase [Aeromicrobium sp. A1-2]AXT86128.1 antibiotic biosynthesis monooxygenase [Aeromicrobium sp. A1-2]